MQTNRYKIYPYPFYADWSKDYREPKFKIFARADYNPETEKICFSISYEINDEYIKSLILSEKIKVFGKLKCKVLGVQKTFFFANDTNGAECEVDSLEVNGDVDIDAFLFANEDLSIESDNLKGEWKDNKAIILKGNLIGESNTYVISADHNHEGSKSSIVSFQPVNGYQEEDYRVDLSTDRIIFGLSDKVYRTYLKVSKKSDETVIVSYLIPAFSKIFQSMIEGDSENDFNNRYKDKEWHKVLTNKYLQAFDEDPRKGVIDPLVATQRLLKVGARQNNAAYKEMSFVLASLEGGIKHD